MTMFLYGACATMCGVAVLFFLRYWRTTGDRFFLFFVAAFAVLGAHWVAFAVEAPTDETRHFFYVFRLLAFGAIIAGIVDKNRRATGVRAQQDAAPARRGVERPNARADSGGRTADPPP
jgi:hypothetical protein